MSCGLFQNCTGPTVIGPTNTAIGHYGAGVAQDKQGNVYLFWDQNPGIYYVVTSTANIACTAGCSTIQYSTNQNNFDVHPVPVALSNGTLLMLFASKRGGTNNFGIYAARYNGGSWSTPSKITSGIANDQGPSAFQDANGKIWVSWQRTEIGDLKIKYKDTNGNGIWDPGEPILYDNNNDGKFSTGRYNNDTVIYGSAPANNTALSIDPRIGFVDGFGYGTWKPGDFVVYDPNTDNVYDPHFMYVDSNNDNAWSQGETIVYKYNYTYTGFTGTGQCKGASLPTKDCVVIGSIPSSTTVLRQDSHLKFVDLNGDGLWEPGETLVYDVNDGVNSNAGVYATNDIAIASLTGDTKLRFIGAGTSWTSGSTVIYNSNGATQYDGGVMFVDDNFTNHWVTGDTVVYHKGTVDSYNNLLDVLISGTTDDGGKQLKNDPGLRFVDSNGNGVWDAGEPVVYDPNRNDQYDGRIMYVKTGTNTTWVTGEPIVYDSNLDGKYTTGRYYNDTMIVGLAPANNTALSLDPKLKFYDVNGDLTWQSTESIVYDSNNNNVTDAGEQLVYGQPVPLGTGLTTGIGEQVIAAGAPSVGVALVNDPRLLYVRSGTNSTWVPGESVVYDTDRNGLYGYGKYDSNVRFVNSTTSPTETWATGKALVYDTDGDGRYIVGKYVSVNDTIISGAVANNTAVMNDTKLRFVDCNTGSISCDNNNRWEQGEAIFYDANNNGVYDSGETIIVGTAPPAEPIVITGSPFGPGASLSSDPLLRYWDSNNNGVLDSSEAVVYDALNKGSFQSGYYPYDLVRGITPQAGTRLAYNIGEPWISGPPPIPGTALNVNIDAKIKFVDLNSNNKWDQNSVLPTEYSTGEPVVYDVNNNGIYDFGTDTIISGTPTPTIGTPLKLDEVSLAGTMTPAGTKLNAYDTKVKFVQSGTNSTWVPGETVVYDSNGDGRYTSGKFYNDTIIAGTAPANNTSILSDSRLKFSLTKDRVIYDTNNDGTYQMGEPIVAVFQVPTGGSTSWTLSTDAKIKYFDADGSNSWTPGESVVYDTGGTGSFVIGDPVLAGQVPSVGSPLSTDTKIKYLNDLGGATPWSRGETVVYDSNADNAYTSNEPVIASGVALLGAPLQAVTHIFTRSYANGVWSAEQRVTALPNNDNSPSITQTLDKKVWLAYDADRGGGSNHQIILRSSLDGVNWGSETNITGIVNYGDRHPVIDQDRNGTIWIVWTRLLSCGTNCLQSDLYMTSSTNNGISWNTVTPIASTTSQSESDAFMVQLSDKNLYTFFTTSIGCSPSCTAIPIYYYASMISPVHAVGMNSLTNNATISTSFGTNIRSGQVLRLSANITNRGDSADTFKLSAKFNSTNVPVTNSSTVAIGQSQVMILNWAVSGLKPGRYVVTANVTDLTGSESPGNLVDNTMTFNILVRPAGDINSDCVVNIVDLVLVAASFGKTAGTPGYNPIADLNNDGVINIVDLAIVGSTFGQTC